MAYLRVSYTSPESCTGCHMCEMICSLVHEKIGINPKRSMIKIKEVFEEGIYIPETCHLCTNPPCVDSCPESALEQDIKTGIIKVDKEKCTGCGICVDTCEFGAIKIHPENNTVIICDLCGGDPQCIKYCLQEAIKLTK